jgi:hypothetical protein
MPNAIVQISKFICAVTSCGGHPTVDVFTHHYELHYQNKKIHLEGSETTLATQFGCISFQCSWFGSRANLTPARRNKCTSGWDDNWFYCRVPAEQTANARGKGNYPLSSTMTRLNYLMEAPSDCRLEDTNFVAFIEATSIIEGHDIVKEFLACGLWPLNEKFGFEVEAKESPLSKVVVLMPQVTPLLGRLSLELLSRRRLRMPQICWWATIILRGTMHTEGFNMGDSIAFLS